MQISLRIRALVVRCLDSIIPLVSVCEISRLRLVSVAEQASLSLTWSETPKTGFLVTGLNFQELSHRYFARAFEIWLYSDVNVVSNKK